MYSYTKRSKYNLKSGCLEVFLLLLSAFCSAMAFPNYFCVNGFGLIIFVSLIPVFFIVNRTSAGRCLLYGFLYGAVYYALVNIWMLKLSFYAIAVLCFVEGLYSALLFAGLRFAKGKPLIQALVWVCYSFLTVIGFTGFPYGVIAYALYRYPVLIQIADIGGIYAVVFLIVLPQAIIASVRHKSSGYVFCAVFGAVFIIFDIVYGLWAVRYWDSAKPDTYMKIATVQHNVNTLYVEGYEDYEKSAFILKTETDKAVKEKPDLICWSETAFIPSFNKAQQNGYNRKIRQLTLDMLEYIGNIGVPLMTGNPYEGNGFSYNAVLLFEEGENTQKYFKQHLVPFTEHFPYKKLFPRIADFIKDSGFSQWDEGSESSVIAFNDVIIGTPICFEDAFGKLCSEFTANGADLFINLTNDSWSSSEACEREHMAMSVFRAVENRKTMLRCTNSGVSCMILPSGKISGEMACFEKGYKIWKVPVFKSEQYGKTLYNNLCSTYHGE